MKSNHVEKLREILLEELEKIESDKKILLPFSSDFISILLFENNQFADTLIKVLNKIDFSNVSFENIKVNGYIFDSLTNVKIDPQTVYEKDLSYGSFNGVEFTGSFYGARINEASFKGSKNAIIVPQLTYDTNMSGTDCTDAIIIGSFDGVNILGAKLGNAIYFDNSKAEFNPVEENKIFEKEFRDKIKRLVYNGNKKNN